MAVADSDEYKQVVLQRKALSKTCESLKKELSTAVAERDKTIEQQAGILKDLTQKYEKLQD